MPCPAPISWIDFRLELPSGDWRGCVGEPSPPCSCARSRDPSATYAGWRCSAAGAAHLSLPSHPRIFSRHAGLRPGLDLARMDDAAIAPARLHAGRGLTLDDLHIASEFRKIISRRGSDHSGTRELQPSSAARSPSQMSHHLNIRALRWARYPRDRHPSRSGTD